MAYETILVETHGRVLLVTLNRPQALNALNTQIAAELIDAVVSADAAPEVGCIVITGSAKAFAAGADIKEMQDKTYSEMYRADWFGQWERFTAVRKPIIAAVAGFSLGGGCELAMMCDFILAADTAKFGQPEIKLGVIPGIGGSQRLTRFVGKSKAMEMCLTGRMMDAQEAHQSGLVSRIVPAAELVDYRLLLATGRDDGEGSDQSLLRNEPDGRRAVRAPLVPFDVWNSGPERRHGGVHRKKNSGVQARVTHQRGKRESPSA
jgi:enoyl-CoA hydratase